MFLKRFLQANLNQRMNTLNDEIKIIFLREMNIDYDYFVNQIFLITKNDNIYFDYVRNDYIKYVNKIISDRIDKSLIHFNEIKLLPYMVNYLSEVYGLYLNLIQSEFMMIMYKYISNNLKDKIKEFDILNIGSHNLIDNNKYKLINHTLDGINNTHDSINIEIYNLINNTYNIINNKMNINIYNFIENHIFNNIKNYDIENYKYKTIKKTNKLKSYNTGNKYYLHSHIYDNYINKTIIKNYKHKNKHENILKKKSSKYKNVNFFI